jgi:hypothetical protein
MDTRKKLLNTLKKLGVRTPSKLYPKRQEWSLNTTPDDQHDRMRAHIARLMEGRESGNRGYGNEVR